MAGRGRSKLPKGDVWVFGYGSLMWDPGFPFVERRRALLRGYHRALCVYSRFHRGTLARPGLVLGLLRGGSCRGMAFKVAQSEAKAVLGYLDERELVSYAYRRRHLPVRLEESTVRAFVYVADPDHSQYAGRLTRERTVELVVQGVGVSGTCYDYLESAVRHLDALGFTDGPLHEVRRRAMETMRAALSYDL
ncbi:MAG: gamma-glutamylcyclotransferase [Alphaproteobacteria bacterium]